MESRAEDARQKVGVLAECYEAWHRGEDGIDASVWAFVFAESLLMFRKFVSKK